MLGVSASAQGLGHCLGSVLTLSVRVSAVFSLGFLEGQGGILTASVS